MDNNNTPNNNGNNPNPNSKQDQFLRHLTHLNKHSLKISKPQTQTAQTHTAQTPVHQPPVYNISKSDFRDVVQKLTGSPSHASGPAQATKPNSSRLQRIRPPPLAPPLISGPRPGFSLGPMSPLPPLPSSHGAAESPISAYMRFLNSSSPAIIFPPPENLDPVDNFENVAPSSPLSFGCLPSPKLALPLSPSPTVPSPK